MIDLYADPGSTFVRRKKIYGDRSQEVSDDRPLQVWGSTLLKLVISACHLSTYLKKKSAEMCTVNLRNVN